MTSSGETLNKDYVDISHTIESIREHEDQINRAIQNMRPNNKYQLRRIICQLKKSNTAQMEILTKELRAANERRLQEALDDINSRRQPAYVSWWTRMSNILSLRLL